MPDSKELKEAIDSVVNCINKKKRNYKEYVTYDFVRLLVVNEFQSLRRTNSKATLIDAVYPVFQQYCPELVKKESAQSASAPAPAPAPQPKVNEELLLRKYYRMQIMSSLATKMRQLDDFMVEWKRVNNKTDKEAAIHRKMREETYNEHYDRASDELEELGGRLTSSEIKYVESIPDLRQKILKLKTVGKGKNCKKCGLPK